MVIDSILSCKNNINPNNVKNCFELFGYDFMIDEDFRTWLIEINDNPYLGAPNDFIKDCKKIFFKIIFSVTQNA